MFARSAAGLHPADLSPLPGAEPTRDCPLCPRLVTLREVCRAEHPDWYNAPVPAFGDPDAWLAVVGLAPGRHGANRTGRPFTGDDAGELLFSTLARYGLSEGEYRSDPSDGIRLRGAIIVNAVKCLPPGNKPEPVEIRHCRPFLKEGLSQLAGVRVLIALGQIAHASACNVMGIRPSTAKFAHGAEHVAPDGRILIDSYHCSRYNRNTGRLTGAMFHQVFERARAIQHG